MCGHMVMLLFIIQKLYLCETWPVSQMSAKSSKQENSFGCLFEYHFDEVLEFSLTGLHSKRKNKSLPVYLGENPVALSLIIVRSTLS